MHGYTLSINYVHLTITTQLTLTLQKLIMTDSVQNNLPRNYLYGDTMVQ